MRGLAPFLIAGAVSLANAAPLADRMEALPAGAVKPRGWMLDRARALAKGYVGCMDGVDADFRRAWTREFRPDPANFSWEHGAWSFEGGGYWFDALVRLAAQLDDSDLMAQAKRRLAPVLDDARPEAISLLSWLDRSDAQAVGTLTAPDTSFPLSKCGYLGRTLTAYWQITRDPRVPGVLAHAFDDMRFLRVGAGLHLPTAAFDAWKLTGDAKTAAALDAFYADLSPIDSPVTRYARLPDVSRHNMTDDPKKDVDWRLQHGVMLNEGMLAWLRGWQWTRRTEYRDAVFAWMDWLRDNATQPHGVIVADEAFGHPGGSRGTETCTVAATIWLKLQLLAATGDGRWADEAERALFNAAPVCANRDFTAHVYFQSPNRTTPLKPAYRRNDTPLMPYCYRRKHYPMCCTADLTRIIPAAVQYKWLTDGEGAVAALYGPDEATLTAAGVKVRLRTVTDYPFDERVTIHVHPERESEWTLKLRIPAWCGKASVAVNGLTQEVSAERGFAWVRRVWRAGDVVTLDLPMAPSFERGRDLNVGADYGVVRYGPFLMAAPLAEFDDDNPVRGAKGDWKVDPARVLRGARVDRKPLGPGFDWPLDAPVKLEVETSSGRVALVPYGCTRFRISMFPLVAD